MGNRIEKELRVVGGEDIVRFYSHSISYNKGKMLFGILVALFLSVVSAHNVLLPPHGRRCFTEKLGKGDELSITFQFGDRDPESSHQLTGDFTLTGVDSNTLHKTLRDVSHGDVVFSAPHSGNFEYCFSNENSNIKTKDVTFNMHGIVYVDLDDPNANTLDSAVRKLAKLTNEVKDEQSYIVIRERTHRNTAESTNDRVKWWSIFQLGLVVANSLFQIYYLKRFFEITSFV
ncbi:GOLD domain profile [Nakaseomyces glabratus]|nr:GOLD domain profile [Nakaseomyces glabratus]